MIGRTPKYDWDVIRALALGGMPLIEISRRLKVKHGTLVNRAFREKWKVRETFGSQQKPEPVALKREELVKKLRQTTAEVIAENGVASRVHLSQAIRKGAEHLGELEGPEVVEKHVALTSLAKSAAVVHRWNEPGPEQRMSINLLMLTLKPEQVERLAQGYESGELKAGADAEECRRFLGTE
jgi:hypothetical protein